MIRTCTYNNCKISFSLTGKTPRVIRGLKAPPGFVLAFQKNAWMTAALMRKWTKEIWLTYTKKCKSLLALDHFKGHLENEVSSITIK